MCKEFLDQKRGNFGHIFIKKKQKKKGNHVKVDGGTVVCLLYVGKAGKEKSLKQKESMV